MYMPPTPIIKTSIETENLGVAERDLLVLDGSDSFDDGSILSYQWDICNTTTCNSTENITLSTTGKRIRAYLNSTGPFYVWLNLTDDTNMIGISPEPIKIPVDKNFNPPVRLSATYTGAVPAGIIEATVKDIDGKNVSGVGVSFIRMSGNATYSPSGGVTNSSGQVSATVTDGGGVIQVRSGMMNPVDIVVS